MDQDRVAKKWQNTMATGKKAAVTKMLIRLRIPAQQATPGPPIGPQLGSKGLKAIDFVRKFNDTTAGKVADEPGKHYQAGVPLRVALRVNPQEKTYETEIRAPETAHMIKRALASIYLHQTGRPADEFLTQLKGVKGAVRPGHDEPTMLNGDMAPALNMKYVWEIAKLKQQDMPHKSMRALCRLTVGSARAMGVKVVY